MNDRTIRQIVVWTVMQDDTARTSAEAEEIFNRWLDSVKAVAIREAAAKLGRARPIQSASSVSFLLRYADGIETGADRG